MRAGWTAANIVESMGEAGRGRSSGETPASTGRKGPIELGSVKYGGYINEADETKIAPSPPSSSGAFAASDALTRKSSIEPRASIRDTWDSAARREAVRNSCSLSYAGALFPPSVFCSQKLAPRRPQPRWEKLNSRELVFTRAPSGCLLAVPSGPRPRYRRLGPWRYVSWRA